jgi:hypothetical protein
MDAAKSHHSRRELISDQHHHLHLLLKKICMGQGTTRPTVGVV